MTMVEVVSDVSTANFETAVLKRSHEVPVLVDFWASWCGPCQVLGPVLENLATEMQGAFVLAKVDSEQNPELAMRYRVQSLPYVLLFKQGEAADSFVGALPEAQIRAFLRPHCPTEVDGWLAEAQQHVAAGARQEARAAFERVLAADGQAPAAHLGLAQLDLVAGDLAAAERHAEAVGARHDEYDAAQSFLKTLALARQAAEVGDRHACLARLQADPEDLEARFALAGHAAAAGEQRQALEHYLAVARKDKQWRDQAARKAMVTVFGTLGPRHPLSDEYRDHLRLIYY